MKRALLYARCSSEESAERGLSIAVQLSQCAEYAERNSIPVHERYVDEGISGASVENRPAFQAMIAEATRRGLDYTPIIVALNTSRLSRNPTEALTFERLLEKHGVRIEYIQLPSSGSPYEEVIRLIFHAIDRFHSLASKVTAEKGMKRRVESGRRVGGRAPYGYRYCRSGLLEPDPETAPVVREYFERRASGESRHSIARDFMQRAIPTATGRDRWDASTLDGWERRVRVYLGDTVWGKVVTPRTHAPLISEQIAEVVASLRRRQTWARSSYLLSGGLLRCGECGSPMHGRMSHGRYRYYWCYRRAQKRCENEPIRADKLEASLMDETRGILANDAVLADEAGRHQIKHGTLMRNLVSELETTREERQKWERLYTQDGIPPEYVSAKIAPLLRRTDRLTRQIEAAQLAPLDRGKDDINALIRRAERGDFRRVLTTIYEAVYVHRRNQAGERRVTVQCKPSYPFARNSDIALSTRPFRTYTLRRTAPRRRAASS